MAGRTDIQAGGAWVKLWLRDDMTKALQRSIANAGQSMRNFGASMTSIGTRMAAAGVASLAPFALALRTFAEFDDQMLTVQAVTQSTGAQFEMLNAKAKALGASTSYTASQVAGLMIELGRAGFVAEQIDVMTGSVLSLSRATGTEAAQSAGIMSAAIRQFGLGAEDAAKVADTLTAGANKSFNTLESLGEALTYAGPVAADFNMSLEDTVAILGTLGNVGIQGSNAGTVVRRMLILTGAEAKKLKGIFGVSFVDAAGNARPLVDTLQEVADATKGMGTAARAAKFNEAFGLLGISGASALAKNITGARDLRQAIEEAGGIADATAAKMDSGLGGAFRILKSSIEGVAIAIGETLAPVLQPLIKSATEVIQRFIEWVTVNKEMVVAVAAVGVALLAGGGSLIAFGLSVQVVAFAIGGLSVILTVFRTAVSAALLPIALLRFGIIATSAAVFIARSVFMSAVAVVAMFRAAVVSVAVAIGLMRLVFIAATAAVVLFRGTMILASLSMVAVRVGIMAFTAAMTIAQGVMQLLAVSFVAFSAGSRIAAFSVEFLAAAVTFAKGAMMGLKAVFLASVGVAAAMRTAFIAVGSGAFFASVGTHALTASMALLGFLTNPLVLVGAAVAALGVWAMRSGDMFSRLRDSSTSAFTSMRGSVSSFVMRAREIFGTLFNTAKDTFVGIKDAIMSGDWRLAGLIAIKGLQLAFLEGMADIADSVGGVFGDTIAKIAGQITGGDISGAWGTLVLGMEAVWTNFTASLVRGFISASREVVKVWRGTVEGIADWMYENAASGGVMGAFFNIEEEEAIGQLQKRKQVKLLTQTRDDALEAAAKFKASGDTEQQANNERLAAEMTTTLAELTGVSAAPIEIGGSDWLDSSAESVRGILSRMAEVAQMHPDEIEAAVNGALDELESGTLPKFEAAAQAAIDNVAGATTGASAEARTEIASLRQQLEALIAEAKVKRKPDGGPSVIAAAKAAADAMKASGGGLEAVMAAASDAAAKAGGGPAAMAAAAAAAEADFGEQQPKDQWTAPAITTYSAAAAQAAGQMGSGGNGPQDKMVASMEEMRLALLQSGEMAKDANWSHKKMTKAFERWMAALQFG